LARKRIGVVDAVELEALFVFAPAAKNGIAAIVIRGAGQRCNERCFVRVVLVA